MFVTRSGSVSSSWASYVEGGGVIITEYNISDEVFSVVFSPISQGTGNGGCSDDFTEAYQFNASDPFWNALGWPGGQPGSTGCGFGVGHFPGVTPIAGWSASQVSTAYRDSGSGLGRLWLAEYDWQDGGISTRTKMVLAYMAEHGPN